MARPRRRPQQNMLAFTTITKAVTAGAAKRKHVSDDADVTLLDLSSTKRRRVVIVTPPQTPTKVRQAALGQIDVAASISNLKRKRYASPEPALDQLSPTESTTETDNLPAELEDLKCLNAAFLSSLSIHYAHNGHSRSADLRMILPTITKLWGKRRVTLEDIQRIVAIIHLTSTSKSQNVARFVLKDFGAGKVCVELVHARPGLSATLHEADTNAIFQNNLEHAWESSIVKDVAAFVTSLPLEALSIAETAVKLAPVQAKRQRRLEEVLTPFQNFNLTDPPSPRSFKRTKTGHVASITLPVRSAEKENVAPEAPQNRSLSLLERIQKKEATAALMPAAPTKEQRERMAALQRAEEILEILNLLAVAKGGAARASFPTGSLVSSIQSSIRSPMAKDEVMRCIGLVATEIAPGHVGMVTFGSVTGVVVDRNRRPQLAEIKARLQARGV